MDISSRFAKRSFLVIVGFMGILMFCMDAGIYFGLERLLGIFAADSWKGVSLLKLLLERFFPWILPASAAFFALCGFILWFVLRKSTAPLFKSQEPVDFSERKEKKDAVDHKLEQERRRRVFLHLLSVLQREGRLLDFFGEDLSLYDDEQIGAAVRSIQEDCKKTIAKYLDLKPVIEREEGDEVVVEPGFDPDAIKLIGNVTGKPPFKGVLTHRGWKANKREIPKLSDILDSTIIVPAEVEIQ